MHVPPKLKHELKAIAMAMAFFGSWIGLLVLLKTLLLAAYHIDFVGWSKVLVGSLILSKVVIVLEHVSLGAWVRAQPAWVDTLLRTALYSTGLAVVLILEHGIRHHHESGGFMAAISEGFREAETPHLVVNTICLSGALFVYNGLTVVRRHLGQGGLRRVFMSPIPEEAPGLDEPRPGSG